MTSGCSETFRFDGSVLSDAIQACFARRRTDWTTLAPLALTPAFYADARLNRRWSDYRTSTDPLIPQPDTFHVVGDRVVAFFGPIRESVLEDLPFDMDWAPGGPCEPEMHPGRPKRAMAETLDPPAFGASTFAKRRTILSRS